MLRATNTVQPDGASVTTDYYLSGELKRNSGARTYPVEYTYDYAGRMNTMKTWKDFTGDSGTAVTTWNYDGYRGWLTDKTYNGSAPGPGYVYTDAGRLYTRTWARGITATYSYNNAGDLTGISYDDGITPAVAYGFDRLGRQNQITVGTLSTASLTYTPAGQLLTESWSGGPLDGLSVTNGYDQYLRRTALAVLHSTTPLLQHSVGYDNASRPKGVTNSPYSAVYAYLDNSPLVGQITFRSNSVTRMTTTKQYDFLNRLTQIASAPSAPPASPGPSTVSFNYTYNNANQRVRSTLADGSYWLYAYDSLGQVTSGKKYWSDGTPVAGQQFEYAFDDIGNRTSAKAGGDEHGAALRSAGYTANNLNQYTSRDVFGAVDIMGLAFATNAVWVNGQAPYRKGEYFRKELAVDNNSGPLWTNITVDATNQSTISGHVFVPKAQEQFYHDADGNLTNDGRWTYTWDAENRLLSLTARTNVGLPQLIRFDYDSKGRRIHKQVWNDTDTNNNTPVLDIAFVYDGWNPLIELDPSHSTVRSYTWGLDLSGSMQGAGGVGGLLAVYDASALGSQPSTHFAAYDGNGNVSALVNAGDGSLSALYEYGPFGELLRATGPMARANSCRFSTKYQDDETDFLYYGYRSYNPSTGRWLSRDPTEEEGGDNLYGLLDNSPTDGMDYLGLATIDSKNRLVVLGKCEIVILYGHGAGRKEWHWKWKYSDADCAAGTAVMCWPAVNVDGLAESMNLWTVWAGERVDEANWEKVYWGLPASGPDFFEGNMHFHLPNANKVLIRVGMRAIDRAFEICKKTNCSCQSVQISFVELDHKSNPMSPKKAYHGVPVIDDINVPCPGGGTAGGCN